MTATSEPARITAGDTVAWTRSLSDYPATSGWVLSYVLINASARINIAGGSAGALHTINVAAAITEGWAAGTYSWQAVVTQGVERYTVGTGQIVVLPNLAASGLTALDTRTAARAALDAVEQALRSYGNKAYLQSYTIAGRQQTFRSPEEFLKFRSKLQAEVRREENLDALRQGLGGKNQVHVRFGR